MEAGDGGAWEAEEQAAEADEQVAGGGRRASGEQHRSSAEAAPKQHRSKREIPVSLLFYVLFSVY
ncbi:hypothetical protein [Paenibacillus taihuensis]|uniref:hypothetical protein n=1 Tax=Paenibacillus taihuensis TaxID=1156355 RepID=UPI0015F28830|nr:hypothetical protein [Paenibacillus taihuensis]